MGDTGCQLIIVKELCFFGSQTNCGIVFVLLAVLQICPAILFLEMPAILLYQCLGLCGLGLRFTLEEDISFYDCVIIESQ